MALVLCNADMATDYVSYRQVGVQHSVLDWHLSTLLLL